MACSMIRFLVSRSMGSSEIERTSCRISSRCESEELFYLCKVSGARIIRKTFEENPAVRLLQNAIVEQGQQAAVVERTNEASKPLLQSNDGSGHLILIEGVSALGINRVGARGDDGIARHGE